MKTENVVLQEPPVARFLFGDTRLAWLWLPLRIFLGWEWLEAGLHKYADPEWIGSGTALMKFWERGLAMKPKPVIAVDWYRAFIQYLLDSGAYVFSEILIGVALILGAFTAVAAFSGGFMNWNFIMAGSASTNGLLFAISTWLVLAWRTSGWIGFDRWLLPALGTPWRPGQLFAARDKAMAT